MADDLGKASGQDRLRINLHQSYEVRDWSHKFGVTPEELEKAVRAVGNEATKVGEYLKSQAK